MTEERLRRAAQRVKDAHPLLSGDLGFRVFRLDSSNIRTWSPDRDNLEQILLDSVEHLESDRTESDVLCELLLKRGLDLCTPVETRLIAKKEVHAVGRGVLFVCLSERIARGDVEALAAGIVEWHKTLAPGAETTSIFRDSAFDDDMAKANIVAILKQAGLSNVRSL